MPIMPATAKLPVIKYAIKNVADDPVIRHEIVFTTLRLVDSITLIPFVGVFLLQKLNE
jgi:hypothetical protein